MSDKELYTKTVEQIETLLKEQKGFGVEFYELNLNKENSTQNIQKKVEVKETRQMTEPDTSQLNLLNSASKKMSLEEISDEIGECTRCKLHRGRKNIVFGDGNSHARLVFVGEGPGRDEDEQGKPFVGRAGKLLTKIIHAMGLQRSDVYICNVVKCRPPENRNPEHDEMSICGQFLNKQLASINPEIVVCLGSIAAKYLLNSNASLGSMRGKFHNYENTKLMVTYHPAALLRNPNFKKPLWEDMKLVLKELKLPVPGD